MPTTKSETSDPQSILSDLVTKAKKAGANEADAMLVSAEAQSVAYRLGEIESLERAESGAVDLRVFIGKKQAVASSSDCSPRALNELIARAIAMAKAAPEDEFCGLAPPDLIAKKWPILELADTAAPTADQLLVQAKAAEDAGRGVKGITNSEGAQAGASTADITLVASNGFVGHHRRTHYSISASMLAGDGTGMETDYDYASRSFAADLPSADTIGRKAGERAVRKLNSRKMPSGQLPVVFEPRIGGSILGHLAGSISGAAIARGTSFLKDMLGKKIFQDNVNIVDDPGRARGLRSYPFDGEGLLPQRRKIIDQGVLTTWLLDMRSSRQLKMKSTGHASRSSGSQPSPSPSNFYIEGGKATPAELMKDIKQGFYITELMGSGINGVTGDYSRAANGYWIENGTITFPVSEMTIAANLKDMYHNLTPANDLQFLYGIDVPTMRIEGMMVAGL